ncbi:predicted acetyltransferase [Longilinea arvoryzae]|uniref:Predicted acetyltransferase n=1 Tax=Longilinea arvoryzae TaxID=360412 RepID=A0A0S7BI10_9CHLR|nr:GNAT family N-acetyltransferase [Longilinea arvoryzae]GAP13499.1 predicted acetyltransferase [Longilinea arvoryzae]
MSIDLESLTLIQLTPAHETACRDFMQEFLAAGETHYGWLNEYLEFRSFREFLDFIDTCARGKYKPEIYVPQTTFFLSEPQGRLLGITRLRHHLNPSLEIEGGHIGYAVRPSARRQGCATRQLSLMLERARAIGLARVLVTCDDDNTGSARTIEKNGGVLEDLRLSPESGKWVKRYWIALE